MVRQSVDNMIDEVSVRTYHPDDQKAVSHLYMSGLLAGQIAANDTGADIENIHEAYFNEDVNHFWVAIADNGNHVLGMIGVAKDQDHTAEIRRLRVQKDLQSTVIAAKLLETALEHCRIHGFLKVILDTRFDPDAVLDLFDRFGFQHTRTRETDDKDLLEFYLNLYRQTKDENQ